MTARLLSFGFLGLIFFTYVGIAKPRTACQSALITVADSKEVAKLMWRKDISYPLPDGSYVRTSKQRENDIKEWVDGMNESIFEEFTTPGIVFFEIKGPSVVDTEKGEETHYGQITDYAVSGLKESNGILYGTVLLPVSGHTDETGENARKWAKTDTFTVYMVDGSGKRTDILANVLSKDSVTTADIALPLEVGKRVSLYYYRNGSAGVAGYEAGRTIHFTWDGN